MNTIATSMEESTKKTTQKLEDNKKKFINKKNFVKERFPQIN